jgi:uncharacterized protein (DUF488 family)
MSYEEFVRSLRNAAVTAVADVRSMPFSRRNPQFNRDTLREELRMDGIAYVFLGEELGGRPKERQYFCDGVADYEKMAKSSDFERGLRRIIEGSKQYRIALMCSEHDPLECHRCLLVGRALHEQGAIVRHILSNGMSLDQAEVERRLIQLSRQDAADLFQSYRERLAEAYRKRANKVAYSESAPGYHPSSRHPD